MDFWHNQQVRLRRFLKGWGANFRGAFKKEKKFLMEELTRLDSKEGAGGLLESEWKERYELEKKMMLAYATAGINEVERSGFFRVMRTRPFFTAKLMAGVEES
jgi:hypothetical protein